MDRIVITEVDSGVVVAVHTFPSSEKGYDEAFDFAKSLVIKEYNPETQAIQIFVPSDKEGGLDILSNDLVETWIEEEVCKTQKKEKDAVDVIKVTNATNEMNKKSKTVVKKENVKKEKKSNESEYLDIMLGYQHPEEE